MKAIVIFVLVLSLIRFGVRIALVTTTEYPRTMKERDRSDDVLAALASAALAAWCGHALLS